MDILSGQKEISHEQQMVEDGIIDLFSSPLSSYFHQVFQSFSLISKTQLDSKLALLYLAKPLSFCVYINIPFYQALSKQESEQL